MKKLILLEHEMEQLQIELGFEPFDNEGTIDSVSIFDNAVDTLGYTPYRLEGEGEYDDTYIFIHHGAKDKE